MQDTMPEREGRRGFFHWLAGQGVVAFEEMRGRPQLRLNELGELPDAQLATSKPAVLPEVEILLEENRVLARAPRRTDAVILFSSDSIDLRIFNHFNGTNTLAEAAEKVRAETGEEPEQVLAASRVLFLRLVALGVCAPVNTLLDASKDGENRNASPDCLEPRA
jgi:hypothetical protein